MRKFLEEKHGFLTSWPLALAVAYNFFFFFIFLFKREWGFNVTLFEIAHLAPIFFLSNNKSKLFYIKPILAILISLFFWTRADLFIHALSLLTIVGLNVIIFEEARSGELVSANYLYSLPLVWIEKFVYYTSSLFKFLVSWQTKLKKFEGKLKSETLKRIIVGIFLSVPVLLILIVLFSSADQNFQNIFSDIFSKIAGFLNFSWLKNVDWIGDVIIQFGGLWLYLCLVFPYKNKKSSGEITFAKQAIEKVTVGVLVSAVFAIFILTQAKGVSFILDGFATGKINPGAFVREGFFQLLIATLVGITVFNILKQDLRKSFLTIFLLIEIFLVSLVAGERVWLYQYQFGLTQARIWGIFSLLFILNVIVALWLNLFNKIDDSIKWQTFLIGFSFIVFCAGVINVDYLVTTKPPIVENKIDIKYMATHLSYDAAGYWVNELKDLRTGDLEYKYNLISNINLYLAYLENYGNLNTLDVNKICNQKDKDWLSMNISVVSGRKQICDNYQNWMNFKREYESSQGFLKKTHAPVSLKVLNLNFTRNSFAYDFNPASQLASEMRTVTTYKGIGEPAINFEIAQNIDVNHSPTKKSFDNLDYDALIKEFNVCEKLNNHQIDEVWIWVDDVFPGANTLISGPGVSDNTGADTNDHTSFVPCGSKTLTLMIFSTSSPYTSWGHLMEMGQRITMIAKLIGKSAEYEQFSNNSSSFSFTKTLPRIENGQNVWACGTLYIPPNNVDEGTNSSSKRLVLSDCDDWNFKRSGNFKEIDCSAWGCNDRGYYTWWMQHIPGLGNNLVDKNGKPMTNWWYAFGKYDEYLKIVSTI